MVRFTFGKNPEEMSEEEFLKLLNEAVWLREYQVQMQEEALARVLVKILGNGINGV